MEYRRFDNTIYVRMDRGEEVTEQLRAVAEAEQIRLAEVNALGALKSFTVGLFDVEEKRFHSNHFEGAYEMSSLHGTITTQDEGIYLHLHMTAADAEGHAFGGHLVDAVISATCEMVIRISEGTVNRNFDETTGLNLFEFV